MHVCFVCPAVSALSNVCPSYALSDAEVLLLLLLLPACCCSLLMRAVLARLMLRGAKLTTPAALGTLTHEQRAAAVEFLEASSR
jgi:hypothetical protein